MRSTYNEEDVTILLKDISGMVEPLGTKEREVLIQSGIHYCEMLAGLLNVVIVVGVVAAYFNTGSWDLAKQSLIFFAIETVLLGVPELCAEGLRCMQTRLMDFMWA